MASFRETAGGWRVEVAKHGERLSRTFWLKRAAELWARDQEASIERAHRFRKERDKNYQLAGNGADFSAGTRQSTVADSCCYFYGLYRARRVV